MSGNLTWMMDAVQSVGMLVLGWYGYLMKKEMADAALIHEMQAKIESLEHRSGLIEQRQTYAPTHADLAAMHEKMNELSGHMRQQSGVLEGLRRSVDRVETHLLDRK